MKAATTPWRGEAEHEQPTRRACGDDGVMQRELLGGEVIPGDVVATTANLHLLVEGERGEDDKDGGQQLPR